MDYEQRRPGHMRLLPLIWKANEEGYNRREHIELAEILLNKAGLTSQARRRLEQELRMRSRRRRKRLAIGIFAIFLLIEVVTAIALGYLVRGLAGKPGLIDWPIAGIIFTIGGFWSFLINREFYHMWKNSRRQAEPAAT